MNLYGYEFQRESDLMHYGVLGMRWGIRKNPEKAYYKAASKYSKLKKKEHKYTAKANKRLFNRVYKGSKNKKYTYKTYDRRMKKVFDYMDKANHYGEKADEWLEKMTREFKNIPLYNLPKGNDFIPKDLDVYSMSISDYNEKVKSGYIKLL